MSRLLNPGAGDLTDRLTILALKRLHYGAAGKDVKHLGDEQHALLGTLRGRELNGAWFEQALELGAVNAALWTLTDQIRCEADAHAKGACDLVLAGELGMRILALNDRRAVLVEAINKLTGEFLGAEKG